MKIKSLVGQKFFWLTVTKSIGKRNGTYLCTCKCGNKTISKRSNLLNGIRKSCGCLQPVSAKLRMTTHGKSNTSEYFIWRGMLDRCHLKTCKAYNDYGGRGIHVCKRWRSAFTNFIADMGVRPSKQHSIERKNNNHGYKPSNCYWATRKEQNSNQRRNIRITFNGETKILSDWARTIGIDPKTLQHRIVMRHWPIEKALTAPLRNSYGKVTYRDETKTITEWAKELSLPVNALWLRIFQYHWTLEKAFNTPLRIWSKRQR